jgi:hypothetical protein
LWTVVRRSPPVRKTRFPRRSRRRADGTVAPKVHPQDLAFSGAAGAGEHQLATLTVKGERLGLDWDGQLPEPAATGFDLSTVDGRMVAGKW